MTQQTAASWLEEKIELDMSVMEILGLVRQAKQIEKEQIKFLEDKIENLEAEIWELANQS